MNYNPRIYIRDYGSPTLRMLAFANGYELDFSDVDLRRSLIMHAENSVVGEEYLLLSGDQQSGSDVLDLSGSGNDLLVLSNPVAMRFFGSDVALQYSNVSQFPSWAYELTFNDADLKRSLITTADSATFSLAAAEAGLLRSVLMAGDGSAFALTGSAANFTLGNILLADPATYSVTASDAGLLRQLPMTAAAASFALAGIDAGLFRTLFVAADAASFGLTFRDAVVTTDNIEAPSGDQQSGGDLTLLSGDQQTGEDFLLISQ